MRTYMCGAVVNCPVGGSVERKRKQKSTLLGKENDVLCSAATGVLHQKCEGESEGDVCEVSVSGRVKETCVR